MGKRTKRKVWVMTQCIHRPEPPNLGIVISGARYFSAKIPGTALFGVHSPERKGVPVDSQEQTEEKDSAPASHRLENGKPGRLLKGKTGPEGIRQKRKQ
jgi:hypothetical protein